MTGPVFRVAAPGIATSVRDGGRPGLAHLGRSRGGAVDLVALRLGNRLVGNPADLAAVETSGGFELLVLRPVLVAVTGSPSDLRVSGGPPLGWGVPTAIGAGATIRIGRMHGGARAYLAVRGGLRVDQPLVGGAVVEVGPDPGGQPSSHPAIPGALDRRVRLWPGPRLDWFVDDAWAHLLRTSWRVQADSDRTGVRLEGPSIGRRRHEELPSEGLVEGAVQVPPDGRPIVMLADHPTTGGYPVIAVVDPDDIGLVAQRPPGSTIDFVAARR